MMHPPPSLRHLFCPWLSLGARHMPPQGCRRVPVPSHRVGMGCGSASPGRSPRHPVLLPAQGLSPAPRSRAGAPPACSQDGVGGVLVGWQEWGGQGGRRKGWGSSWCRTAGASGRELQTSPCPLGHPVPLQPSRSTRPASSSSSTLAEALVSSSCGTALVLAHTSCPPERSARSAASQRVAGRGYWQSHLALRVPKPGITPPSGLPCPGGPAGSGRERKRERRTQRQAGNRQERRRSPRSPQWRGDPGSARRLLRRR